LFGGKEGGAWENFQTVFPKKKGESRADQKKKKRKMSIVYIYGEKKKKRKRLRALVFNKKKRDLFAKEGGGGETTKPTAFC